jgi:hypothetical protein
MFRTIVNCETGEEKVVEFTADDLADQEATAMEAEERATAEAAIAAKRARLAELKAKGWAALTSNEKTEAQGLMLELA